MQYPQITVHYGANIDTLKVDGVAFDRYHMKWPDRVRLTRLASQGWRKAHERRQGR